MTTLAIISGPEATGVAMAYLHADASCSPSSFVTRRVVSQPVPDILVEERAFYMRDAAASQRLRRPTYVRATFAFTGPVAAKGGLVPPTER